MIIDKVFYWLQIIMPAFLLAKAVIMPYFYKKFAKFDDSIFTSSKQLKLYKHKRCNETNELHTTTLFLYGQLLVWLALPRLLQAVELQINLGNAGNYVGAIIESGFFLVLQLHTYKYSIAQKMNVGDSIKKISYYKHNYDTLIKLVYVFLIAEFFLQASIVGLIPFFQIDHSIIADVIVQIILLLAACHIIIQQKIISSYSKQSKYLRSWTIFTIASVFRNAANAVLTNYTDFLDLPIDSESVIIFVLLTTVLRFAVFLQLACLTYNSIQTRSMEEWYD